MRTSLLKLALSCAVLFGSISVYAGAKNITPIEAFIQREKEQQTFVPVNGLWENDTKVPASAVEPMVSGAQLFQVNFGMLTRMISNPESDITLTVPNGNGGYYTIELARFDFMSQGFQVFTRDHGVEAPATYTPGVYYRGVVNGVPGSIAAFSFYSNQVSGVFSIPGVGNFILGQHNIGTSEQGHYVLYNDMNLKMKNPKGLCGTDKLPANPVKTSANKNVYSSCKEVEVFLMADFQMFTDAGSSVQAVGDYLMNVYNMVATMYRNEAIYTSVKAISVNTSPDIYEQLSFQPGISSHDYLFEFGEDVQNNIHDADLAMLVSTVGLNMGGVAWLGTLCAGYNGTGNPGPYSFCNILGDWTGNTLPVFSWDIEVMTHEMGHNYGSPHTHACAWNGANQTAIDGCMTLEGGCPMPVPQFPVAGGTVMSYCHLQSTVGINLANGFGKQPGDLIRNELNTNAFCATSYAPNQPAGTKLKTLTANRECTDENDVTYYWNDNNNAKQDDDFLALKIRKVGANIGNLDDGTMSVKNATTLNYGNGSGASTAIPKGTFLMGTNIGANRYWKVTPTTQPAGEVEVIVPFLKQDIMDIDGSVPNTTPLTASNMHLYALTNASIDPNPAAQLTGATVSDLKIYTNGTSASNKEWSIETKGDTILAHFNVNKLVGGSMIYSYSQNPAKVQGMYNDGEAVFYPNPTHDSWNVYMPNTGDNIHMSLYTVDGRVVAEQQLKGGALNEINATQLAAGLYYYRISSSTATFTGSLQKR